MFLGDPLHCTLYTSCTVQGVVWSSGCKVVVVLSAVQLYTSRHPTLHNISSWHEESPQAQAGAQGTGGDPSGRGEAKLDYWDSPPRWELCRGSQGEAATPRQSEDELDRLTWSEGLDCRITLLLMISLLRSQSWTASDDRTWPASPLSWPKCPGSVTRRTRRRGTTPWPTTTGSTLPWPGTGSTRPSSTWPSTPATLIWVWNIFNLYLFVWLDLIQCIILGNGWIFQLNTFKKHFYSHLENFQPCCVESRDWISDYWEGKVITDSLVHIERHWWWE